MRRTGEPAPAARARPGSATRTRSPGVRLGRRATRSREDLVEPGQRLLVEVDLQRTQRPVELLDGPRTDDRGGHRWLVEQPCQADVRGMFPEVLAERLIRLDGLPVGVERLLGASLLATNGILALAQDAAEQAAMQG